MAETEIKKINGRTICDETARKNISGKVDKSTTLSLKEGTAILENADLNTYVTLGNFNCTNATRVKTILNRPTDQAFKMVVGNDALFDGGTYKYQEIVDLNGDEYWRYTWDSGVNWSEWRHRFDDSMHIPTENGGFSADVSTDIGEVEHLERIESFVTEMSRIAQNIGMANTIVKTPSGYNKKPVNGDKNTPSTDYNSYTTACDALKLLIAARHTPTVAKAMGSEQHTFIYNHTTKGNVLHSVLYNDDWKSWAENNGYTILGAKGGSLSGSHGEIGSNGILNMAMLVEDANANIYGVTVLGLQYATDGVALLRTLIADLVSMANGSAVTTAITNASTRSDYPVCMAIAKLSESGTFEDDIAMLSSGIFYNENEVRVSASIIKLLVGITAAHFLNNQYVSVNNDDLVGGSHLESLVAGTVLTTYDALYIMLLASDNAMATLLARVYGNTATGFSGNYNDLTNKPTIPTKTSQLTNDSGFLKFIPSEYVTETELSAKGYAKQTAIDNLSKEIVDQENALLTEVNSIEYKNSIVQNVLNSMDYDIFGVIDENNNIIINTDLASGTYILKSEALDGTLTDIASFEVGSAEPTYTNLFDKDSCQLNTRLSSSGASASDGYILSNTITIPDGVKSNNFRIYYANASVGTSNSRLQFDVRIVTYLLYTSDTTNFVNGKDENGCAYIQLKTGTALANAIDNGTVTNFRIAFYNGTGTKVTQADADNIILTLNEPIV